MYFPGISDYDDTAPRSPRGFALAEAAIDGVIAKIDEELTKILPVDFAFDGLIRDVSFGSSDSAPALALHYNRAHEVIWKTLRGVKDDLIAFQEACREAKNEILKTDEESAARFLTAQNVVETLAVGAQGRQGEAAHEQARQDQDTTMGANG